MQKTAILDVDGVLLNIMPALFEWCLEKHGKLVTEEFITNWDFDYCLGIDVTSELWEHIWDTPAPLYDGADRFIEGLKNAGFKIMLLSARPTVWKGLENEAAAREAAERDFKQIDYDEKILVENGKEKWKMINWMIEEEGVAASFMVEDNPIYAKLIGKNTPIESYLLTRPWNRECVDLEESWKRVMDYGDLLRQVI